MKPTIGRIVIVRHPKMDDRECAAIVSRVHSGTSIDCHVFQENGVSVWTTLEHASVKDENGDIASMVWDWPKREG